LLAEGVGTDAPLGTQNKLGRIGSQVVVPYRGSEKDFEHLKVMGDLGQIVPVPWHARHRESTERAIERSNVVVNLVAHNDDTKNFSIEQATVDTARAIAEAAAAAPGVHRVVFVSCAGADASAPSRYLRAKAEAERVSRSILGDKLTVVRTTTMFGDEDRFFHRIGRMARQWPFIPRLPDRRLAPVYVSDVAEALVAIAQRDLAGTYELQGPSVYQQNELFQRLCEVMRLRPTYVNVPDKLLTPAINLIGLWRNPIFTRDEWLARGVDEVFSGALPGLAALGVKATHMEDVAIQTLRLYRRAELFYDVSSDTEFEAEAEIRARLTPPDYSKLKSPYDVSARRARLLGDGEADSPRPSSSAH
jgi:NADH dehydrogenase (ubiquinone) 1 alpha subcomplex subunit 9